LHTAFDFQFLQKLSPKQ